jgi:hypothetical protein
VGVAYRDKKVVGVFVRFRAPSWVVNIFTLVCAVWNLVNLELARGAHFAICAIRAHIKQSISEFQFLRTCTRAQTRSFFLYAKLAIPL